MPSFARRILIFAAVDGLILQPAPPRNHKPSTEQAIKLEYKSSTITALNRDRRHEDTAPHTLDSHGVVGLLKIASSSYLISINAREQVAQIFDKPIYSISEVALIPLSSQSDAEEAITRAQESQRRRESASEGHTSSDDSDDDIKGFSADEGGSLPTTPAKERHDFISSDQQGGKTSIAEDVISRKGLYGRFAQRWFSKKGWNTDAKRNQGISSDEDLHASSITRSSKPTLGDAEESNDSKDPANLGTSRDNKQDALANDAPKEVKSTKQEAVAEEAIPLLPKVLTVTKLLLGSKNFYFSLDYDLSRSLANQPKDSNIASLHRSFDPLFFWNRSLVRPFAEAGFAQFTVPVIQGFVGQRAFSVSNTNNDETSKITHASSDPEKVVAVQNEDGAILPATYPLENAITQPDHSSRSFVLTLISRRSTRRAGLRYLRRGVDEEGNVANSVESEQILSDPSWKSEGSSKVYSFVQYRGSIPLIFHQSPFSLKPVVNLTGSPETNALAFRLHFQQLASRYGRIQSASLVEKKGNEAKLGSAYEKAAEFLNSSGGIDGKGTPLSFEWFDFHGICRGMKFENVSQLFDTIGDTLKDYGWTEQTDSRISRKQQGVLRTNCMDCLDRTNVVQSACARNALEAQLADQGITIDLNADLSTSWFNNVWADNGDAISRQYAGTAALKGDFTRTRKRTIPGALSDFGLTLTRYYNNIVNDYFAQAVIDYLLGTTTEATFIDFEADMKAQDYAVDLRKVRENAIDTCQKICVEDAEDLIAGWTLSCPNDPNTLRSQPFQECVLLLTPQALYFCRMDWETEKVREFERIDLRDVEAVAKGVYITSAVAKRDLDEKRNVGFVVRIASQRPQLIRVNTRSLANEKDEGGTKREGSTKDEFEDRREESTTEKRTRAEGVSSGVTEQQDSKPNTKLLAFKALPAKSNLAVDRGGAEKQLSEEEVIADLTEKLVLAVNKVRRRALTTTLTTTTNSTSTKSVTDNGAGTSSSIGDQRQVGMLEVEDKDIITAADAKRSTGYLEQLGYSIKKLVWAT